MHEGKARILVSAQGEEIVRLREVMDLSQRQLAHEAGVDRKTLRRIETSELVLPQSLYRVCMILGVEPQRVGQLGYPPVSRGGLGGLRRSVTNSVSLATLA
jgi:transcriptional regulator with XRE-family HTH domain